MTRTQQRLILLCDAIRDSAVAERDGTPLSPRTQAVREANVMAYVEGLGEPCEAEFARELLAGTAWQRIVERVLNGGCPREYYIVKRGSDAATNPT